MEAHAHPALSPQGSPKATIVLPKYDSSDFIYDKRATYAVVAARDWHIVKCVRADLAALAFQRLFASRDLSWGDLARFD